MQKPNTLLLVIVVGLLVGLWLKPEARRYELFRDNYLFDTASGRLVMIQVSEEVKADLQAKESKAQELKAKDKAEKDERMSKTCPAILAEDSPKVVPGKKRDFSQILEEDLLKRQRRQCEEWLRTRNEVEAAPPARSGPR